MDHEVKKELYVTIHMYPDLGAMFKTDGQMDKFKRVQGMLGLDMVIPTKAWLLLQRIGNKQVISLHCFFLQFS